MTTHRESPRQPFAAFAETRGRRLSVALLAPIGAAALLLALTSPWSGPPSALAQETCPGDPPTPTAVAVTEVPIVVASATDDYFVLYVTHDRDGTEVDIPVLVKKGEAGTTTLAETIEPLPAGRYRVERYLLDEPADVDRDCIDDITELDDLGRMNPLNPAPSIDLTDGAVAVPDRAVFDALTRGTLKFVLLGMDTDSPSVYFVNTRTHPGHRDFLSAVSIDWDQPGLTTGWISHYENAIASDGSRGVYAYSLTSAPRFSEVDSAYTVLAASVPLLEGVLSYFISDDRLPDYRDELALYRQSRISIVFIDDILMDTKFIALNEAEGYGLLRVMDQGERPDSRDIVIYDALPNTLPRVAGIITTVPQTPLSHVNLRAVQDGAPNAFIRDALADPEITMLIDRYVRYSVAEGAYTIAAATREEVNAHYASSRPSRPQTPQRNLLVRTITPLSEIGFDDWTAFGVKAANVAVLGTLGFPQGTVPDGFAIPFYFYDEFMNHNGFYDDIRDMLADPDFQADIDNAQEEQLEALRDAIENAQTPEWILAALANMNEAFPDGINRRYRSSTNNEDLPGFNGAGLYDSKSQKPSEDEDDLAKSLKEVYASLWNFRAFSARDFHRIDHLEAAMGILVHPSYQDELANGVAATFDPAYGSIGTYYLNTQVGEDLVTNPDALSVPEEILLRQTGYTVVEYSNQVTRGQLLMTEGQLDQLRGHLGVIHDEFRKLYQPAAGEPFAMEIEFKVTSDDVLAIKQARPWVFSGTSLGSGVQPPIVTRPPILGGGGGGGFAGGGGGGGGGPSGPTPSEVDFEWTVEHDIDELDSGHDIPTGMWSDGATLWLLDNPDGTGDAVYAYSLESGERAEARDFELDETNRAPRGVWSDRTTIWVSDSGPDRLFAHDIATGERTPERDIELDDRNADPRGIWSDGETMWVLDNRRNALFAYDLGSGELLGEYTLADANDGPHGIWSDLTTIWVSNHDPKQLFAYRLPRVPEQPAAEAADPIPLERVRDEDFTEPGRVSNNSPRGIWSDGDVMYVADENDGRVYSYNMPDAIDARLASLELEGVDIGEFDPGQTEYEGIPDDGVTQTTVAAEPAQDGASVDIEPVDADDDARGHQVALAGAEEIVVAVTSADGSRERLYRVSLPTPSEDDFAWNGERDIERLDPENDRPTGLWSDGATLWVIEDGEGSGGAVYAYDLASGERAEEREFALDETNRAPRGVWSDRMTVWVSDSDQDRLFAYDLGTGGRAPERDIELDDRNGDPRGIWSDGDVVWVLDGRRDALFAYDIETGALLGEYTLDEANDDPRGVWSDRVTVWVSNHDPKQLFAYRLPRVPEQSAAGAAEPTPLERVLDEEFTELSKANNNSPRGLWSDGQVMYVADENDGRVYSYNMPDAIDARLVALELEGVDIGEFDGDLTEYEGVPGDGVTQTTVAAEPAQSGASVDTWPADADEEADGHQIALTGIEAITVTVTSPDESRRRLYRVSLPTPSEDDFAWNGERDIEQLDPENDRPTGLWSDGATLWVIEDGEGSGGAVYAYDLASGERAEEHEFALDETNRAPPGVWSDRVTVWVSDSDQNRLFAYDLGTGERDEEREFALAARNGDARSIWSDGEVVWVLDADGIFVYDIEAGALLGEYTLDPTNTSPHGIWSDHTTIWVSNDNPKQLFAYRLPRVPEQPAAGAAEPTPLERVPGEDFTELSRANNNSPRGIWSDGDVMYVADEHDGRVYSYNVPDAWDARLASLALSGVEIGEFDPGRTGYEGVPDDGVTQTTVAAEAAQDGASVETRPADADEETEGHQVDLGGAGEITVTVTSADRSRERVYRVALAGTGPPASCLSGDVAVGFSLVIYEGGSVEELESCAQSRHVTALYALDDGEFVSYILGAPGFVNERFGELYADGVPELTPLTVKSDGPATADPGALVVTEPWTSCLRGEIVQGFSHVLHEGGSVDDLTACAQGLGVTALYALDGGSWVSYILGAPDYVSRSFRELFADGVAVATPLVARSE